MNPTKIILFVGILVLCGCASGYQMINPNTLSYQSTTMDKALTLEYKYNLLYHRYAKEEIKSNVRLLAVKLTNNSGRDLTFGKDITLAYTNDKAVNILPLDTVYHKIKQGSVGYLLYLLLTPATLSTSSGNGQSSSAPIGFVLGPGLAAGNMIAAGNANKNFKNELLKYNIAGEVIKNGDTLYGLVGIQSDNFDAIKVKVH